MSAEESQLFSLTKKRPRNLRTQKPRVSSDSDDDSDADALNPAPKHRKHRHRQSAPNTKKSPNNPEKSRITYHYNTTGAATIKIADIATRTLEIDTETDRDARALLEKRLFEEAETGVYKGQTAYHDFQERHDTLLGNALNSKVRTGPIRAPAHLRVTTRFDYQPDVCKDYKETGFCGYGDGCKFLHDRGDYKMGWELDLEWEELQKNGGKKHDENEFLVQEEEDELPFACSICREDFKSPVISRQVFILICRCGHYFCEECALKQFEKTPKCFVCNAVTGGTFNRATKLITRIEERNKKREEEEKEKEQG